MIALRGQCIDAARLPALIGWIDDSRCGLATFQIYQGAIELVTLNSLELPPVLDISRMNGRYTEQQLIYGATVYWASLNFCKSSIFAVES